MKLIVGLGNPGKNYVKTRHNAGFMVVDNYVRIKNLDGFKEKFNGEYIKNYIEGQEVIFLKPLSFMNLSGEVVRKYVDYFNIDISDILIICDDMDHEVGTIKLKYKGSCGGHNGLLNIESHIGTREYKRLKVGIGRNSNIDSKDYVLSKFSNVELEKLDDVIDNTVNVIDDFLKIDFEKVMSKYN